MPNLTPPVTTVMAAIEYKSRILKNLPKGQYFEPLMTLYLTESMPVETIAKAKASGVVYGCKLYPAGATTHSAAGVHDLKRIYPLLEAMQREHLPLLIHGEVVDEAIDIFDREAVFIERHLIPLLKDFPELPIVLEHISTRHAAEFVQAGPENLAATITAHHLWLNRNQLLAGGLKPHHYCLPILKTGDDQAALVKAAISGNTKFFLGTDSAPHAQSQKESACGCAGIYTAFAGIELYAEIFARENALGKLAAFASKNGARFYGLPINQNTLALTQQAWQVPETLEFGGQTLIPFLAGQTLNWQINT